MNDEYTNKIMKVFLNGREHNNDYCIVCGHDIRKDNVYYDINGATVCYSCMNTVVKIKGCVNNEK